MAFVFVVNRDRFQGFMQTTQEMERNAATKMAEIKMSNT